MLLFLGNEKDDTENNNMMTAVDRNSKCFIIVAATGLSLAITCNKQ